MRLPQFPTVFSNAIMFLVGLTGGIASGKSTVANIFKEHSVPIIDADVIARKIVEPGEKAWNEIHQEFGDDVFKDNGELDREVLGKVIFSNSSKRVSLNKITHPKIERMIHWQIIKYFFEGHQFVVLDIPLLFEIGSFLPYLHKIITVSCEPEVQHQRLIKRNQFSEDEAWQRINSQMPLSEKCLKSHFVIENSGTSFDTRVQTERILKYVKTSNQHHINKFAVIFITMVLIVAVLFTLHVIL